MLAVGELQGMLGEKLFSQMPSNSGLMQLLTANLYMSQHVLEFVDTQLKYFNCG